MEKGRQKASKINQKMQQQKKTYKKHPEKNNQKQIATKSETYVFGGSRGEVQPRGNEPFGASGPHLVHMGSSAAFVLTFGTKSATRGYQKSFGK